VLSSEFIVQAVSGSQELVVNPVTLAEVLVLPTRDGTVEQVLAELGNLGVLEVPFPPGAAQALARLRVTGLRMPDCCVLLSAIDSGAPLVSFDGRLVDTAVQQHVGVHQFV
jgi:predicted nucleic acid-binding protein